MRCLTPTLCLLVGFYSAILAARAEYPAPAQAGFHHCALIYDKDTRTAADFAPYVAYDKKPAWLFDAFLFLIQNSGRERGTEYGLTEKVDWEYQLDRWFGAGRDLKALDDAVENATHSLGAPPVKRRIMLSIPYINRGVSEFGTVEGKATDLSTAAGRDAAVRWYLSEAARRFANARYRHLQLWGFYWMREDIPESDVALVKAVADQVHRAGFRLLWIPYHGETGIERWKPAGVDVAIYQPNYAFGTWQSGGRIGRNRIAETAQAARASGLGVEMEASSLTRSAAGRRAFAQYLADGAASRYGYQAAATAYYLETDLVEQTSRSIDPEARRSYDMLARYVTNDPVPDPDAPITWRWKSAAGIPTAEARFGASRPVAAVEMCLNRGGGPGWGGVVEVSVLKAGARKWSPGGWAIRGVQPPVERGSKWLWVPVGGEATAVRAQFRPAGGSGPLRVASLAIDPNDVAERRAHIALGQPYTITPARPGKYADSGHMLTDGITLGGFQAGRTVGWMANGNSVSVSFDLGRPMPVSEIQAFTQGGGVGAVSWPSSAVALFADTGAPPRTAEGRGGLPKGFTVVSGGAIRVDRRRAADDMDGHISFLPSKPLRSRHVTLVMTSDQWLMLSEVRIYANGRNVAPTARYSLRPFAGGGGEDPDGGYADDGVRLTDGVIARHFNPSQLTGWRDGEPRTITVDLGWRRPVREVTVWVLQGGENGIHAPHRVFVDTSNDGVTWQYLGGVAPSQLESADRKVCVDLACRISAPQPVSARYVRVRATQTQEWAMLSEIEVH
ncbi:MAG TPA: DUF4855 domain-containing protein [Armatimonadota bacterium]|jgi:hypothetical protein